MCGLCGDEDRTTSFGGSVVSRRALLTAAGTGLAAASLAAAAPSAAAQARPADGADLIFHNGDVVTDPLGGRTAHAVAVAGNRILAVGDTAQIMSFSRSGTRKINLHGRMVIPGF